MTDENKSCIYCGDLIDDYEDYQESESGPICEHCYPVLMDEIAKEEQSFRKSDFFRER